MNPESDFSALSVCRSSEAHPRRLDGDLGPRPTFRCQVEIFGFGRRSWNVANGSFRIAIGCRSKLVIENCRLSQFLSISGVADLSVNLIASLKLRMP